MGMTQTAADPLLNALNGRRLLAISGPNFSGRTDLLRHFCDQASGRIYLGPEVYNALSGLAASVRQEIELHAGSSLESSGAMAALEELQLIDLLEQNPGLLSGGEQACLAVLCGLALKPANLAIDCALEQLDAGRLAKAIALLNGPQGPSHGTVVTDNRLDEWPADVNIVDVNSVRAGTPRAAPVPGLAPEAISRAAAVTAPTIEMRQITVGYRKRPRVLKGVNVKLQPGRVYILAGPNGAGKSTCAKVLCGVLKPTEGEIRFGNEPARPWKTPGKVVGYHLQNPDVGLFESTVLKELGGAERAQILLDAFGLRGVSESNPLALPFPVRKRVSLAAVIACNQPWLFLDEPTLGADAATITSLAGIVKALADKGHGVIVVSHSSRFRQSLNGEFLHLEDGIINATPPTDPSQPPSTPKIA
jgi:energy-coupling factor transport system ATP-binding protein